MTGCKCHTKEPTSSFIPENSLAKSKNIPNCSLEQKHAQPLEQKHVLPRQVVQDFSKFQFNHEFHETCHSITFYFMIKDTTMPESIHTKDESKRGTAFAFIFGVN